MELIDWKQLRKMAPWCRAHVQRLEDAGLFPRRVRLSVVSVRFLLNGDMEVTQGNDDFIFY